MASTINTLRSPKHTQNVLDTRYKDDRTIGLSCIGLRCFKVLIIRPIDRLHNVKAMRIDRVLKQTSYRPLLSHAAAASGDSECNSSTVFCISLRMRQGQ